MCKPNALCACNTLTNVPFTMQALNLGMNGDGHLVLYDFGSARQAGVHLGPGPATMGWSVPGQPYMHGWAHVRLGPEGARNNPLFALVHSYLLLKAWQHGNGGHDLGAWRASSIVQSVPAHISYRYYHVVYSLDDMEYATQV